MKDVFLRLCSVYIPSAARAYNDRVVVGSGGDVCVVAMVVRGLMIAYRSTHSTHIT